MSAGPPRVLVAGVVGLAMDAAGATSTTTGFDTSQAFPFMYVGCGVAVRRVGMRFALLVHVVVRQHVRCSRVRTCDCNRAHECVPTRMCLGGGEWGVGGRG
jgi:hypothetical protein